MIVPRISSALLHDVTQYSQRHEQMHKYFSEMHRLQNYEEQSKLLAIQESHRLLRNYNYAKDTEEIRMYVANEALKEQRLLNSYRVTGIFFDRYV